MGGSNNAPAPTRYAGIQVQTSSLGIQIPVGWGTFRCRCNLVDYLDFQSKAQKAASGKGGSTTTGYSYSATIILALCEGPIDAITQVWVDGKNYAYGSNGSGVANTPGATSALGQVGLTLAHGAVPQAPWGYLTTAHADHAIGYAGLAIVYAENYALDSSASTPSHNFELVRQTAFAVGGGYTGPDVDPSLVVADFFQNPRTGVPGWPPSGLLDGASLTTAAGSYRNYCLAAGLLISPVVDQQRSGADFLNEVFLATNATCVWSEGLLKFVPYGDTALTGNGAAYAPDLTPIYSLDDDDYIVKAPGDDALTVDIEDQSDAYNAVQMEYLDRTNQYSMAIALASDAANIAQYTRRLKDPDTVHVICTASVAAIVAQLWLQRTLYIRAQYKLRLSWAFALLEPGDILELTDVGLGLAAYPVRIIQVDEDDKDGALDLTCEDLLAGVSHAPLYTMQGAVGTQTNMGVDPGGVEANLLLWSQDFTQSVWTQTNLTVTAGAATDPLGFGADIQKLTPTTTSGVHTRQQSIAAFAGASYTYQEYYEADGYTQVALTLDDGGANSAEVTLDLVAGQVVSTSVGGTGAILGSPSLVPVGSAWRLQLTVVAPATTLRSTLSVLNNAGASTFAGDGTSGVLAFGAQITQGVAGRTYAPTGAAAAGPVIFNPPSALTAASGPATWAAVSGGPNWGGCNVWVSLDGGSTYAQVGAVSNGPSRFGTLTASFAAGADPDTADTCSLDLSPSNRYVGDPNGQLDSAADAVADQNGTLALILDPAGVTAPELISFSTATPTQQCRYSLTTYIRRGQLKTTISAHAAGAEIVRLDDTIFDFPFLAPQAGQTAYAKFQSFNLWGQGATPLSNCNAYAFTPSTVGSSAPGAGVWIATAGVLSNGGQTVPAIFIAGASDNPSAQDIEFYFRQSGSGTWLPARKVSNAATSVQITDVAPNQAYDVGVAYQVNGVMGAIQTVAVNIVTGGIGTGGGSFAPGAVLFDSHVNNAWSYTCIAGSYTQVLLENWGPDGNNTYSGPRTDFGLKGSGGSGGHAASVLTVTPGTTVLAGVIGPPGAGQTTTTTTGATITANAGDDASGAIPGAGGTATGGTTNTTGVAGGAQDPSSNGRVRISIPTGAILTEGGDTITTEGGDELQQDP